MRGVSEMPLRNSRTTANIVNYTIYLRINNITPIEALQLEKDDKGKQLCLKILSE